MAGDRGRQRWDESRDNDVVVFIVYSVQGGGAPTSAPSSPTPTADVTGVTESSSGSPSPSPLASPPRITAVGGSILGITKPWQLFAVGPGGVVRIRFAAGQVIRTP